MGFNSGFKGLNTCVLCSCHEKQDLRGVFQTEYIKMHKDVAVRPTKAYMGSILNLGTKWRYVVNFRPRPFYHRESTPVSTE